MKKKIYIAAMILFAILFLVSAVMLTIYFVQIHQSQTAYDALAGVKEQAYQQAWKMHRWTKKD